MILVVLATRGGITKFSGPLALLRNMRDQAYDYGNFEVIIRGDSDDPNLLATQKVIAAENFPFPVTIITGLRGRGYEDLNKFYNECYVYACTAEKKLIFPLPEDVTIEVQHWDKFLLDAYEEARQKFGHDFFTMHQTLLPGLCDTYEACLESPDAFPICTKDWVEALGGFGDIGSNDSLIQAVHYFLVTQFGLDVRHMLPGHVFTRHSDNHDSMASLRWANARLDNHDVMRRKRVKAMLAAQARTIYLQATAQKLEYFNNIDLEKKVNVYDAVNYACDNFGAGAILYRSFYNLVKDSNVVMSLPLLVTSKLKRLFGLKTVVPFTYKMLENIYKPMDGNIKNLEKKYQYNFWGYIDDLQHHQFSQATPLKPDLELKLAFRRLGYKAALKHIIIGFIRDYLIFFKRKKS